ncbi:MAG: FtsB family cell division protein [Burkholderiales bacterium]
MAPAIVDVEVKPRARRKARPAPTSSDAPPRRRTFQVLLVFVTLVLIVNALVGERGLTETLAARQHHAELVTAIEKIKMENARLREEARQLQSDPTTIESLARQELGLIRPGEMLFIIKDAKPAPASR